MRYPIQTWQVWNKGSILEEVFSLAVIDITCMTIAHTILSHMTVLMCPTALSHVTELMCLTTLSHMTIPTHFHALSHMTVLMCLTTLNHATVQMFL